MFQSSSVNTRRTLLSLWALLFAASALAQLPHTHEHVFSGAEKWAQVFDDPQRDA